MLLRSVRATPRMAGTTFLFRRMRVRTRREGVPPWIWSGARTGRAQNAVRTPFTSPVTLFEGCLACREGKPVLRQEEGEGRQDEDLGDDVMNASLAEKWSEPCGHLAMIVENVFATTQDEPQPFLLRDEWLADSEPTSLEA